MNQVTIKNDFITLTVLDFGAVIQKLMVKNKFGTPTNVVAGYEEPTKYIDDKKAMGVCVGRYAGRISQGGFVLEGKRYPIYAKDGVHLHGGKVGFGKKYWTIEKVHDGEEPFVRLTYLSVAMEEGYPGNLQVSVTYKLSGNVLHIDHRATTDKTTVVNLTNHSYFRLDDADKINGYDLQLNCPQVLETRENLLPTGRILPVKNTKYDFLKKKKIGPIRLDDPMVIDKNTNIAGYVHSDKSGISMQVITNQPAVVIYTPPGFPAICFETQNYPDAPNQPNFPSSVLKPGETYLNESEFIFGVE
ncbi:galactose mutarotase [Flavobacteriaceae bacterium F89]|uniref:Galactose mutarotase n=1 Tax=Cerina litoralis TaxID=2874477 RepID=A0AAE3EVI1_9FLAO|nr:aldose epimerase family protein [Cerina litoralis]MCG2460974.1 galactose mutarotase [Cerina litoralis]